MFRENPRIVDKQVLHQLHVIVRGGLGLGKVIGAFYLINNIN